MRMRLYKKEGACYDDTHAVCAKAASNSDYLNILDGLGASFAEIKLYEKAKNCFNLALTMCRNIAKGAASLKEATILSQLGCMFRDMGKTEKATRKLNESLDILKLVDPGNQLIEKIEQELNGLARYNLVTNGQLSIVPGSIFSAATGGN